MFCKDTRSLPLPGTNVSEGQTPRNAIDLTHLHEGMVGVLSEMLKDCSRLQLEWRHLFYRGAPKSSKNKKNILRTIPLVRNFPLKVSSSKLLRTSFWCLYRKGVAIHASLIRVVSLLSCSDWLSRLRCADIIFLGECMQLSSQRSQRNTYGGQSRNTTAW